MTVEVNSARSRSATVGLGILCETGGGGACVTAYDHEFFDAHFGEAAGDVHLEETGEGS